jgi:hypothetical protein
MRMNESFIVFDSKNVSDLTILLHDCVPSSATRTSRERASFSSQSDRTSLMRSLGSNLKQNAIKLPNEPASMSCSLECVQTMSGALHRFSQMSGYDLMPTVAMVIVKESVRLSAGMGYTVNVGTMAPVATATQVKMLPGNAPMATDKLAEHFVPTHRLKSVDVGT